MMAAAAVNFMVMGPNVVLAKTEYAVYYSNKFQSKQTASSEIFDQSKLYFARPHLRFSSALLSDNGVAKTVT
jgi:rare lipoprotein A (peptidoglycan hydrolase)